MRWSLSHRFDTRALPLADRHYNRQKLGTPQFVPPASCVVLLAGDPANALWVSIRQKYVKHSWPGAWCCSCFRNEGEGVASELIVEALSATRFRWGNPPPQGMITFVDPRKVRTKRTPGHCFIIAGFRPCGETPKGLVVLKLEPADFPDAAAPIGGQRTLGECA